MSTVDESHADAAPDKQADHVGQRDHLTERFGLVHS